MAEIGIAASIITLLQLLTQVTVLSSEYILHVKNSQKEAQELIQELHSLEEILRILESQASGNTNLQPAALQTLGGENGPLQGCLRDLNTLRETLTLTLTLTPKTGVKELLERFKWPARETEINAFKARLERHKTLFLLAMAVDQISVTRSRMTV